MKNIILLLIVTLVTLNAEQKVIDTLFENFKAKGASTFDAAKGKQMWETSHMVKGEKISCVTCHTANLKAVGEHYKSGKKIQPMAVSIPNEKRFKTLKHANKWFKRNCKQVYERECTAQEKGDFLAYIVGE